MKPVSGIAKLAAAASALSITFALVWTMANHGYPGSPEARIAPMAAAQPSSKFYDVR
jgi:hypothetical protein